MRRDVGETGRKPGFMLFPVSLRVSLTQIGRGEQKPRQAGSGP